MIDKQFLIDFESGIKDVYEAGDIKAPIHLSGGNEDELIKIFEDVNEDDWVFSSWRNHYHALLHGIKPDELAKMIVRGKSMSLYSEKPKFYSSSIVGGIIPIAVGTAKAQKLNDSKNKTWCFVGDMTFESGIFYEAHKYARNHNLPLQFVVEDNGLSTNTPTDKTWGGSRDIPEDIIYYKYEREYPHHGTGNWILF
jgi:pyruvate dehydrogenase E1 component alpha subunit